MLSLACTLAAESRPPSGASAVFSASVMSASILTDWAAPTLMEPPLNDLAFLSSLTSSDTREAVGGVTSLARSSASSSELTLGLPASMLLRVPKKLPTWSMRETDFFFSPSERRGLAGDLLAPPPSPKEARPEDAEGCAAERRGAFSPSATDTRRIFCLTCSQAILMADHSSSLVARELKILMSSSTFLSDVRRALSFSS
mmetsp:Transcript_5793/g.11399  ORF Transcript_5793/g.11399 Transcript_5793/m.11399 type:complete len:200 (-) Transcript_5793:1165-1764(-)